MDRDPSAHMAMETSQLLTELDDALGQCTALRDIVDRSERLHSLECLTGPSSKTRILRQEIDSMQRELSLERCRHQQDKEVY